jgi:hypothetical protein
MFWSVVWPFLRAEGFFCNLDPDPYWIRIGIQPQMLELDPDPDPDEMNADPQPCWKALAFSCCAIKIIIVLLRAIACSCCDIFNLFKCRRRQFIKNNLALSATPLKIFCRYLRFSSRNSPRFDFFGLVLKSHKHAGLVCLKTPEPSISSWAPLITTSTFISDLFFPTCFTW